MKEKGIFDYKKKCRLCNIYHEEKDDIIYENMFFYVVATKNKKGHKKRIMAVAKEHSKDSRFHHMMWNDFAEFCRGYFDYTPAFSIYEPTFASQPQHWHRIACDWITDDPEEKAFLKYTPHTTIMTDGDWTKDDIMELIE